MAICPGQWSHYQCVRLNSRPQKLRCIQYYFKGDVIWTTNPRASRGLGTHELPLLRSHVPPGNPSHTDAPKTADARLNDLPWFFNGTVMRANVHTVQYLPRYSYFLQLSPQFLITPSKTFSVTKLLCSITSNYLSSIANSCSFKHITRF